MAVRGKTRNIETLRIGSKEINEYDFHKHQGEMTEQAQPAPFAQGREVPEGSVAHAPQISKTVDMAQARKKNASRRPIAKKSAKSKSQKVQTQKSAKKKNLTKLVKTGRGSAVKSKRAASRKAQKKRAATRKK